MASCEAKEVLTKEERNLLSVAYKNVVGTRRSAWRAINALEEKQEGSIAENAKVYKEKIADEVREYCTEVIVSRLQLQVFELQLFITCFTHQNIVGKLLEVLEDPSWAQTAAKDEHYVFYVKMKGDYYRYISEVNQGSDKDGE